MESETSMNLLYLPVEMINKILSYLSYDQIAKLRAVNSRFNTICSDRLNQGFILLEQFHNRCLKAVKTILPRRESERKHHPLARHSDILTSVETRLSMLSMTFSKYIEAHHCCFIPGKVLDEAFKVLQVVSRSSTLSSTNTQYPTLPRPFDFLQEYRDISSMAMEHFEEKILPSIREKMRLENPRLYLYNKRGRAPVLATQPLKMPQPRMYGGPITDWSSCSRFSGSPAPTEPAAEESRSGNVTTVTLPALKLLQVLRHTKSKYSSTRKAVVTLHRNIRGVSKKLEIQTILMKRKLNQQKTMIKHMRRELRDTRNAMSVMSKELNRLKIEQSSSRDQTPSCSNLSVTVTSSLSIPVKDEASSSSDFKVIKRKRESSDEGGSKR